MKKVFLLIAIISFLSTPLLQANTCDCLHCKSEGISQPFEICCTNDGQKDNSCNLPKSSSDSKDCCSTESSETKRSTCDCSCSLEDSDTPFNQSELFTPPSNPNTKNYIAISNLHSEIKNLILFNNSPAKDLKLDKNFKIIKPFLLKQTFVL